MSEDMKEGQGKRRDTKAAKQVVVETHRRCAFCSNRIPKGSEAIRMGHSVMQEGWQYVCDYRCQDGYNGVKIAYRTEVWRMGK